MTQKVIGRFSNKEYCPKDALRILDPIQATLYWNNHVEPLDIYPSRDYKTKRALIVFVFKKSETKRVYDLWCRRELY